MMFFKNVKLMFWANAMLCEIYLRNRSPSHALNDKTPYECGMAAFLQSNILDFLVPPVIP